MEAYGRTLQAPMSFESGDRPCWLPGPIGITGSAFSTGLALQGFGDALDAAQPCIPGRSDSAQLRDHPSQLGLIDIPQFLPPGWCSPDELGSFEHAEMFGDRLTGNRELLAERGRSVLAGGQEQIQ